LRFVAKEFRLNKEIKTTSLYIHVPFCLKKCPYCDFFSIPIENQDISGYVDLLLRHLELLLEQPDKPQQLESIFFGGGTPSLLPVADVGRILEQAEKLFGLTADVEISLEANPGTISEESLIGFKKAGINRLSLGLQSLCAKNLHRLGRQHDAEAAHAAIRHARQAGFTNLSCDLMFALPDQSIDGLKSDLQGVLDYQPEHLAIYGLTVEPGTPFLNLHEQGALNLPDEDLYVAGYYFLHEQLAATGYDHYEISNFARPGFACRHNQRYWTRQSNLAIGAGAHSLQTTGWGERWAVPDSLDGYQADLQAGNDPARQLEIFDRATAMAETLYLGFRTSAGVNGLEFKSRFGVDIADSWPDAIRRCGDKLSYDGQFWRLNLDGWLLFNSLLSPFL